MRLLGRVEGGFQALRLRQRLQVNFAADLERDGFFEAQLGTGAYLAPLFILMEEVGDQGGRKFLRRVVWVGEVPLEGVAQLDVLPREAHVDFD